MRNTKQNDLVYNVVVNTNLHYTAEEVYLECVKIQPNISLGTVYRNLNKMVENKKIRRIKMPDNIDRFDKSIIHAHAICMSCGKLIDIFDNFIKKLPNIKDFMIIDYDLVFSGICKECQKEEN